MFTCQRFTIKTPLKPYLVREKLMEIVEPTYRVGENSPTPLYRGKINKDSFQITKIIYHRRSQGYQESFLPVIKGQIKEDDGGSQINIEVKMGQGFLIFFAMWLITAGRAAWVSLMTVPNESFAVGSSPVVIFVLGLVIPVIVFYSSVHHSKKFLINFLKER